MKKLRIIATFLIAIMILSINDRVQAVVNVDGNWNSMGRNNACFDETGATGGYIACYIPKFEFRVTLVNKEGQKVAGTKSVEYGYSTNGRTTQVTFTAAQKQNFVNGDKYGYRYSAEYNDYNPISAHSYYQVNMVNTPRNYQILINGAWKDNPSSYNGFIKEFEDGIHSKAKRYGIDSGTQGSYDFLTMFLYHSGFLNKNESGGTYYSIDDETNEYITSKRNMIATEDFYMLIEPLYTIFYNETSSGLLTYKYGTAAEIGQLLYSKTSTQEGKSKTVYGYMAGLSLIFTYNAGSNLYTNPNTTIDTFRTSKFLNLDIKNLEKYNTRTPCPGDLCSRLDRIGKWGELADTRYGYGVDVLRLSADLVKPHDIPKIATLNLCGEEVTKEANDGIIEFTPFSLDTNNSEIFTNESTKLEKSVDANNKIYCYDGIKYDFSETIGNLDSNKNGSFRPLTGVTIKPGKLTVNRYCYIEDWSKYETSFTENFSMYTNQKIPLELLNSTIYLQATKKNNEDIIKKQNDENGNATNLDYKFIRKPIKNPRTGKYDIPAVIQLTAEIEFSYNNKTVTVPSSLDTTKNYPARINLSNASYGYSTKLINELAKNNIDFSVQIKNDVYNYHISMEYRDVKYNENDKICSVVSKIDGIIPGQEEIKFRTIALDNPFPARDATSRMPGSNWLGINNYVRGYITYNRGVTGEEVYDKNPIYTIKLTPDTMIKIREYNKKHNYADIDLNCSGENNTECMSEFLRDTSIFKSESVTGSCMITSNTYKDITNGVTGEQLRQKMASITDTFKQEGTYDSRYDFNHDKRINNSDVKIFTYAEKTTPYYTCADKTFENSGYLGRSEN